MKNILCLMKKGVKWYMNQTLNSNNLTPTGIIPYIKE